MRVVHVIVGLGNGGAEAMLCKLLQTADHRIDQYHVISLTDKSGNGEKLEMLGVNVYSLELDFGNFSFFKAFFRLVSLLRKLNPDLVHGWMYHANIAILLAAITPFLHYKMIWNIRHSLHDMSSEKKLTRFLIKLGSFFSWLPSRVVFNSYTSLSQHQKIGYVKRNALVIPNGFDFEIFRPRSNVKNKNLALLNLSRDTKLIGIVARFHEAKGYKYFVEAADNIAKYDDSVQFILVGKNVFSKNNKINKWIKKTSCENSFHLLGEQNEISEIIPSFKILVSSSITESFPNVIGEAMACGVPCVVTDVGDSSKIVENSGIVVPPKDANALSEGVIRMLSWNDEKFKAFSIRARKRIIKEYSLASIGKQYDKMYCDIVG